MTNPNRWVLLSLLLVCLYLPQAAHAASVPQDARVAFRIRNDSSYTFCTLYISPTTATAWGDNYLGESVLEPRRSKAVALTPGVYDVTLLDCTGERQFFQSGIKIASLYRLTLNDQNVAPTRCYELLDAGVQLGRQGSYDEALEPFQMALTCFQSEGIRSGESDALNYIGIGYFSQGRYEEALATYEQVLTIRREIGDRLGEGIAHNNIGLVYEGLGRYEAALEIYEEALAIWQEMGHRAGEGGTLTNIGSVYSSQGRYKEALVTHEEALAIHREVGDRVNEGATLSNIGTVYDSQGRFAEALATYEQALAIRREIGDRAGEGIILTNIGAVYLGQGRYEEALVTFEQALAVRREVGDRAGEGITLSNIGTVYARQGRYDETLAIYEQALAIFQEVGDRVGEGAIIHNIGSVYIDQGRYDEALVVLEQALAISRDVGDRAGEGITLGNIGLVYESQERYEEALVVLEQALAISRDVGDRVSESFTLKNIGAVYDSQGRYDETLAVYEQAADILEGVRAVAGSEEARAAFIDRYTSLYDSILEISLILNHPVDAFLATERGRARAFLDSLATGHVQLRDTENSELLMQERDAYTARQVARDLLAEARAFDPPDPALVARREESLQMAEEEYARISAAIAAQGEQLAALVPGRSVVLDLAQVQALLDEQTTLLSYWMLEEKSIAFVITATSFSVVELPEATATAIATSVSNLYQWFSKESAHPRPLQELYSLLVEPLASMLTTPHVIIVPHQTLHYVPFAALSNGDAYFGSRHTLSILPSATALSYIEEKANAVRVAASSEVLVLGNPTTTRSTLLYAEQEAVTLGALLNTAVYTGTQATEARLWDESAGKNIIHLATHGEYNQANSLYSAIFLAPDAQHDGRLETWEIFSLPLAGTDLVVLSACETNRSDVTPGDELVGLTRAFFFAGAPTVLSSLWQVNDAATEALMTSFYRNWKEGGLNKAASLQAAQAEVAADPRWRSPYYWSGFVLNGHPGERVPALSLLEQQTAATISP